MKHSKDPSNLPYHVPIGSPSIAPTIFLSTLPSQKPSSDPPFLPSSKTTTHPIQAPGKNPQTCHNSPIIETI